MKLIIHAGFSKTGSTAIQTALDAYAEQLKEHRIFRLGNDLQIGSPGNPQWLFQTAADDLEPSQIIADNIRSAVADLPSDSTVVISSENLEFPSMPRLFSGLDEAFDCSVIFYVRPQFLWIPSAWKQWYLKDGTPLSQHVELCLQLNMPGNLIAASSWQTALPNASIRVHPLTEEYLVGGSVLTDFFSRIGSTISPEDFRANENIDYSLLHVMSCNARTLFSGPHDASIEAALMEILPSQYRATNAPMLDQATATRIHEHFRYENLALLGEFSEIEDPQQFLDHHFAPKIDGQAYINMDESLVLERASRILIDVFGRSAFSGQLATLLGSLKPPGE